MDMQRKTLTSSGEMSFTASRLEKKYKFQKHIIVHLYCLFVELQFISELIWYYTLFIDRLKE